jgi:hypothetical protein
MAFRGVSQSASQALTRGRGTAKEKGSGIKFRPPPPATTWNQTPTLKELGIVVYIYIHTY